MQRWNLQPNQKKKSTPYASNSSSFYYDHNHLGFDSIPHMAPNAHMDDPPTATYKLTRIEALTLLAYFVCNAAWSVTASRSWDVKFNPGADLVQSSSNQVLCTFGAAAIILPIPAVLVGRYFECDSDLDSLTHASIAAFAELFTIIPWNGVSVLLTLFWQSHGYSATTSAYLGSVLTGPGVVAGPLQSYVIAALNVIHNDQYKMDPVAFLVGISVLSFISPMVWSVLFLALADFAKEKTEGIVAQAFVVACGALVADYLTFCAINVTTHAAKKTLHHFFHTPYVHRESRRRHAAHNKEAFRPELLGKKETEKSPDTEKGPKPKKP